MMLLPCYTQAQSEGVTPVTSFHIVKEVKLPILSIEVGSLQFSDANGNNVIDANEQCSISFRVRNSGVGDAYNCTARLSATGATDGIDFNASTSVTTVRVGCVQTVTIPITSDMSTCDGNVEFTVQVDEPNKMGTAPMRIVVTTHAFLAPLVQVSDYRVNPISLDKMAPFTITVIVQNMEQGAADNVVADIVLPVNVNLLKGDLSAQIGTLAPGQAYKLEYSLVANYYAATSIPIQINLREKHGRYAENRTIPLLLDGSNQYPEDIVVVQPQKRLKNDELQVVTLSSDVDKNIPQIAKTNENLFAFIIANENYKNPGFAPVSFAHNDGKIFEQYCLRTLGMPRENVSLHTDASLGDIRGIVSKMMESADLYSNAHFVFYYAGHGAPKTGSNDSFLVPVDALRVNEEWCYKLQDLYDSLRCMKDDRVTVFLDACFSGFTRNNAMLDSNQRAAAIKPKKTVVYDNTVVFAATSNEAAAFTYPEQQHGLFTYYLLKKLQETKGNVTYAELQSYLKDIVSRKSRKLNSTGTAQIPMVGLSSTREDDGSWKSWKLR